MSERATGDLDSGKESVEEIIINQSDLNSDVESGEELIIDEDEDEGEQFGICEISSLLAHIEIC